MTELYEHEVSELERIYGARMVKAPPIDFWVTVPTTWEEPAVGSRYKSTFDAASSFARETSLT